MDLIAVKTEDRELLWNINQKYLYEMTNYYDDALDERGVLHYGYFDAYFTDPKRQAFFLRDNGVLVGFAMLHPYSAIGDTSDHVMAEFTVFPAHRKKRLATEAVNLLFLRFPGNWEIKYHERNVAAKSFWLKTTAAFAPRKTSLTDVETVLSFCVPHKTEPSKA